MQDGTPRIVITSGEPAGIGPDLCARLACTRPPCHITLLIDPELLAQRAEMLGLDIRPGKNLDIMPVRLKTPVTAGKLHQKNVSYVLEMLDTAVKGCQDGHFHAMVTAPVHKGVINEAGIPFSGHTEYLARLCKCEEVVMMLATHGLRVALATTHLPVSRVSQAITRERLTTILHILHSELINKFGIASPEILVCGLNPHAGEGGYLGREEIDTIEPVLDLLRKTGMDLVGPMPADTLFSPKNLKRADAVLAMYHDQGLPVLKHIGFGKSVNITLGLPIIRTSVDHGTALELAGGHNVQSGSLMLAIETALEMI